MGVLRMLVIVSAVLLPNAARLIAGALGDRLPNRARSHADQPVSGAMRRSFSTRCGRAVSPNDSSIDS